MDATARRIVALVILMMMTAAAAVAFFDSNLDAWVWFNYDPQGFEQQLAASREAAAFGYTSGNLVGQLAALLFGCHVGWGAAPARLRVAPLGGVLLALVNLAVAAPLMRASSIDRLWMVDEMSRHSHDSDPSLPRHGIVILVIVASYLSFPLWACLGYGIARHARPRLAALALAALVVPFYLLFQVKPGTWWLPVLLLVGLASCSAVSLLVRASPPPGAKTSAVDKTR